VYVRVLLWLALPVGLVVAVVALSAVASVLGWLPGLARPGVRRAKAGTFGQEHADGPIDRIRVHWAQHSPESIDMRSCELARDRVVTRSQRCQHHLGRLSRPFPDCPD
jgi:hypothetical protein